MITATTTTTKSHWSMGLISSCSKYVTQRFEIMKLKHHHRPCRTVHCNLTYTLKSQTWQHNRLMFSKNDSLDGWMCTAYTTKTYRFIMPIHIMYTRTLLTYVLLYVSELNAFIYFQIKVSVMGRYVYGRFHGIIYTRL